MIEKMKGWNGTKFKIKFGCVQMSLILLRSEPFEC